VRPSALTRFVRISWTGQRGGRKAAISSLRAVLNRRVNAVAPNLPWEACFARSGSPRLLAFCGAPGGKTMLFPSVDHEL
jgi:hypothetical protein